MEKRTCPHCFTRWYSSDSYNIWKCESCGHDIPVPEVSKDGDEIADCNSRTFQDIQTKNKVNKPI